MNTDERSSTDTENFVIAKTAQGYRVCSLLDPARQYVVSGLPNEPHCTCPEFQGNEGDPQWSCKHILAVLGQLATPQAKVETPAPATVTECNERTPRSAKTRGNGGQMVLKRSVSPDGRIDSLSVEFACPIGQGSAEAIKAYADYTLKLQGDIVEGFLKTNAKPRSNGAKPEAGSDGAVSARMIQVGGMDTRWGRRIYIAVEVNGQTLKLFGNEKQLAEALAGAGFAKVPERLTEGLALNFPCRAITKPSSDGRYVNVERVLPAVQANGG